MYVFCSVLAEMTNERNELPLESASNHVGHVHPHSAASSSSSSSSPTNGVSFPMFVLALMLVQQCYEEVLTVMRFHSAYFS